MFHDSKLSCSDMFIPKQEAGTPQIMRCQIASPTRLIRTSSLRPWLLYSVYYDLGTTSIYWTNGMQIGVLYLGKEAS
jgi:hypothetical protein